MNHALGLTVRVVLVVAGNLVGFVLLQHDARLAETWMASHVVLLFAQRAQLVAGTDVLVSPWHHVPFLVVVTPACSSIASVCSLAFLASLLRSVPLGRLLAALAVAVLTIVVGNVLRIAGSIAVGLFAGEAALVLFHDWVGTIFAFAYTLVGFVMLISLLLPRQGRSLRATVAHA